MSYVAMCYVGSYVWVNNTKRDQGAQRRAKGDLSPHGGDLQPTCAKRPAHKRTGDRDFLLPSAAQRVQLRTNTAQRVLGGVRLGAFDGVCM